MTALKEDGESFDMAGGDKVGACRLFHRRARFEVIKRGVAKRGAAMYSNLVDIEIDARCLVAYQS